MKKIFLGIGTNMGNREGNIEKSVQLLSNQINHIRQAEIYETKAWGVEDQPDFLNTVISGYTDLHPEELLIFIKQIEKKIGRIQRQKWGPREIDIDIIFYGDEVYNSETLTIPHRYCHERGFVLKPLMDLDPNFIHPYLSKKIAELLKILAFKKFNETI